MVGHIHQPKRLSVAFGTRHTKIPMYIFFGGAPFLVADQHHRSAFEPADPPHDGRIIREPTIPVKLHKVGQYSIYIVECIGTIRVPGKLHHLPAAQVAEDLFFQRPCLIFKPLDLLLQIAFFRLSGLHRLRKGRRKPRFRPHRSHSVFALEQPGGHHIGQTVAADALSPKGFNLPFELRHRFFEFQFPTHGPVLSWKAPAGRVLISRNPAPKPPSAHKQSERLKVQTTNGICKL